MSPDRSTLAEVTPHVRGWAAALLVLAAAGCSSSDDSSVASTVASSTVVGSTLVELPTAATDDDDQGIGPPTQDELPPPAGPRVCPMVSLDEITAAIGVTAVADEEAAFGKVTTCFVQDDAGEKLVSFAAGPASGFADAASTSGARPVDGLGDDAVWADGKLHVLMGDEDLAFKLFPAAGVADDTAESVVEAIAAGTVSRYTPPPDETTP